MKKRFAGIMAAVLLLAVMSSGCTVLGLYPCDPKEVASCQIVRVNQAGYTVLAEVEDTAAFVDKFLALRRNTVAGFGDSPTIHVGDVVVRIELANGDYDLVAPGAQFVFHPDKWQAYATPHFAFDEKGFEELIKEYYPGEQG